MKRFFTEVVQSSQLLLSKLQFSVTVILTLGLTMGMLIATFNLNYLLLAKPLPYPESDRLVNLWVEVEHKPSGRLHEYNTPVALNDLYKKQQSLSSQALMYQGQGMLTDHAKQPNLPIAYVTHEYFTLLGAKYIHGAGFTSKHELTSKIPEVVINFDAWVNWFNKAEDIVGQTLQIGDVQFKIIGVLQQNFVEYRPIPVLDSPQLWLPWGYSPLPSENWNNSFSTLASIAKLPDSQSALKVESQLTTILENQFQSFIATDRYFNESSVSIKTQPLHDAVIGDKRTIGYLLFFGAAALLLIACGNIVNLFLSRAIEKSRTLAIQAALGAKPKHIFSSLFAESILLTVIAMGLGLIICAWCFVLLRNLAATQLPRLTELSIDNITIAFALSLSLLLALIFSLLSFKILNYSQLKEQLQSSGKGSGLQISPRSRNILVVVQVTLTSLMLIGTSMVMKQSLDTIAHPLGFSRDGVMTFELELGNKYPESEEQAALLTALAEEIKMLPEVEDVSRAIIPPIRVGSFAMSMLDENGNDIGAFQINRVDANYFDVISLPLLYGRTFEESFGKSADQPSGEILLSESAAKAIFGDVNVVGRSIKTAGNVPLKIVGVVGDIFNPFRSNESNGVKVYLPYATWKVRLILKQTPHTSLTKNQLSAVVDRVAPGVYVKDFTSLEDIYQSLLFKHRLVAWFVFGLSLLALMLAGAGIYGVLNYSTQMRRYELGVRLSLGAKTHTIIAMVLRDNLKPISIGIVSSVLLFLLIYGIGRHTLDSIVEPEMLSITLSTVVMVIVALLASYIPIRNIVLNDPIQALRYE